MATASQARKILAYKPRLFVLLPLLGKGNQALTGHERDRDMSLKSHVALTVAAFLALATITKAEPALQLDIVGGTYDLVHEDIVTSDPVFQLAAILNPTSGSAPDSDDTFYIAVSLLPATTSAVLGGSFVFNGTTVNVTADMTSGTPNGLSQHGQFPNFYKEFSFTFDLSDAGKVLLYDVATSPGGPTFDTTGTAFAKLFTVDKSGLADGIELHFDLYNKTANGSVDKVAPFSHDASTIPEPTGFVLTLGGLGLFSLIRRRRS